MICGGIARAGGLVGRIEKGAARTGGLVVCVGEDAASILDDARATLYAPREALNASDDTL